MVEKTVVGRIDEKLCGSRVWIAGARHGDGAGQVLQAVVCLIGDHVQRCLLLILRRVTTTLNHELGDHPVEDGIAVVTTLYIGEKVGDREGGTSLVQLNGNGATVGYQLHHGRVGSNHRIFLIGDSRVGREYGKDDCPQQGNHGAKDSKVLLHDFLDDGYIGYVRGESYPIAVVGYNRSEWLPFQGRETFPHGGEVSYSTEQIDALIRQGKNSAVEFKTEQVHADSVAKEIVGSRIRIQHFEDRIEFISPGRLPNTVTIEKLSMGVSYAVNPVLLKFMENQRYIDKLGRGLPMVYQAAKERGKEAVFEEVGEEFKVVLPLSFAS